MNHPSVRHIVHREENHSTFDFRTVHTEDVRKALKELNPNKAVGWDLIPPWALKLGADELSSPLTTLYNNCLSHGIWPSEWKRGEWVPVFKKDDPLEKENYRPVTVQMTVNKIFEQLLAKQVTDNLDNRLSDFQTAYRKRHSCETALIMLIENWRAALDKGELVGLLSTDMSKAFDSMYYPLMQAKLKAYGTGDNSLDLIRSYFSDRFSRVKIGNATSSWKKVTRGCPQGSAFGPLLWNLFQNDLTFVIKSNLCMYADDHQFYDAHTNVNVVQRNLQDCAINATAWYDGNFLKGNFKKYGSMTIGKNKENMKIAVKEFEVESYECLKLLGVYIDSQLNFTEHISSVCKKGSQRVGVIMRLRNLIPTSAKLQLYKAAVLPHLTYCHTIWHFCKASDSRKLERVQERGLRAVFCDKNSSYDQLLIKARLPSLMNRRLQDISCLMYKVKNNLCPKYICDLFKLNNCVYNLRVKEFTVPRFETVTFGKHSLKYLGPTLWSKIQPHIRHSPSLGSFKRAIRNVDLKELVNSTCTNCTLCNT